MTKNEYIASIMLEAAELLKENQTLNENGGRNNIMNRANHEASVKSAKNATVKDKIEMYGKEYLTNPEIRRMVDQSFDAIANNTKHKKDFRQGGKISKYKYSDYGKQEADFNKWYNDYKVDENNPLSDKQKELHAKINARGNALKEAIDLLYDKAANADTLDEATMYIDRAEQLESMIEE